MPNKRYINEDHEGKMAYNFFRISFAILGALKDKGFAFLHLTTSLCRANKPKEILVLCQIPFLLWSSYTDSHYIFLDLYKSRDIKQDIPNGF